MKTSILILSLLLLGACTSSTQSPMSNALSPVGKWSTSDLEYNLTIAANDSAYMYEKFDSKGEPDSSFIISGDSLFVTFPVLAASRYALKIYADSLSGTGEFGDPPIFHSTFYRQQ